MKNKIIISGVLVLVVIAVWTMKSKTSVSGVYCSQKGTLTSTQTIQSHRSYCLKSDSRGKTYSVASPTEYSFSIVDDQGNTLKDFAITHTQLMHVIVARKDLAYFQHIHPEFNKVTGQFTFQDLTFPADGDYRIFADFTPPNAQMDAMGMPLTVTLSEDVSVGSLSSYKPQPIGPVTQTGVFDGYQVALATDQDPIISGRTAILTFDLNQNEKPITDLQTYLGALGHSIILREGTLDFIHAHPLEDPSQPQGGKVDFAVDFAQGGTYKIFTQFQRNGKVFTTSFVVSVIQGPAATSDSMPGMDMNMPGMHH